MADGSMFGQLRNYADPEFAKSHPDIIIYTPTEEIHYKVCANVIYTDEYVTMIYDDNIAQDRDAFLRSAHNNIAGTYWLDEYEVTGDSHIITLQTCIGDDAFRRFIIAVADEVISTGRVVYDP